MYFPQNAKHNNLLTKHIDIHIPKPIPTHISSEETSVYERPFVNIVITWIYTYMNTINDCLRTDVRKHGHCLVQAFDEHKYQLMDIYERPFVNMHIHWSKPQTNTNIIPGIYGGISGYIYVVPYLPWLVRTKIL